jgi:agmatinase
VTSTFDEARAVILPVPLDRTTSYVPGTRNGPREILAASAQVELWDEELQADPHVHGIVTLPEMEMHYATMDECLGEVHRVAAAVMGRDKFLMTLGGEHSLTPPLVKAAVKKFGRLSVLQIDAHADLRDTYMDMPNSHACAMRRVLDYAPVVQVGIRNISESEVEALPTLDTRIFYDWNMRDDPQWMDRVVDALGPSVYLTIDADGIDPSLMPAVGTPEPGGLTWSELTRLLRKVFRARDVVAADLVELCPLPGVASPNFVCAKLVYKILGYKFTQR